MHNSTLLSTDASLTDDENPQVQFLSLKDTKMCWWLGLCPGPGQHSLVTLSVCWEVDCTGRKEQDRRRDGNERRAGSERKKGQERKGRGRREGKIGEVESFSCTFSFCVMACLHHSQQTCTRAPNVYVHLDESCKTEHCLLKFEGYATGKPKTLDTERKLRILVSYT